MSKLPSHTNRVTIAQAACYLSERLNENYTEAEVLQLGLDGDLVLSVQVNRQLARPCKRVSNPAPPLNEGPFVIRKYANDNTFLDADAVPEQITGDYDLTMLGSDYDAIFEKLTDRHDSSKELPIGAILEGNGQLYELCNYPYKRKPPEMWEKNFNTDHFEPTSLMSNHLLFIEKSRLIEFEQCRSKNSQPRKTPEEIVEQGGKAGRNKDEIVATIDAEWTGKDRLKNAEIGALFPRAEHETTEALRQRGKRLRGKKT